MLKSKYDWETEEAELINGRTSITTSSNATFISRIQILVLALVSILNCIFGDHKYDICLIFYCTLVIILNLVLMIVGRKDKEYIIK